MDLLTALAILVAGLLILAGGGEVLVRGATAVARLAGLTPAVIGLTVVAMGTSLPELVVSVISATGGQPDIAVGNVLGSNIFNVTLILGVTALIVPLPVRGSAVQLEWPAMFAASAVCVLLLRDLKLDRLEGGFFLLSLILFTAYSVHVARGEVTTDEREAFARQVTERSLAPAWRQGLRAWAAVAGGLVLLLVGGRILVVGAVDLARMAGLSERVIGLTVVGAGTSMPELATSLIAALRRQTDVAVANLIGSNIFNVLGILGVTALVRPFGFAPELAGSDMWWMLGTSFLLLPIMLHGMRISRWEGGVLVGVYVVYVALLF